MAIAGNKIVFLPNIFFFWISETSSSYLKTDFDSTIKSVFDSVILSINLNFIFKMSDTFSVCPSTYIWEFLPFSRFSAESAIPNVVVLSITRELAPVLAGLMVAGRSGAAIAAEIGTMKVTEQIDALKTLSTNPYNYLVVPRVLAGVISLPILVFIGDIIGVLGGYLICTQVLNFNPVVYLQNTYNFVQFLDVLSGLVKAFVFGFIITFMGCYYGFNAKGGAQGVGMSTTYSVVSSSILILLINYILTSLFFNLWGK